MRKLLIVAGAIIYVLCPVDLIPDVIPVIGWLDDVLVIAAAVAAVCKTTTTRSLAHDQNQREHQQESPHPGD